MCLPQTIGMGQLLFYYEYASKMPFARVVTPAKKKPVTTNYCTTATHSRLAPHSRRRLPLVTQNDFEHMTVALQACACFLHRGTSYGSAIEWCAVNTCT